MVLGDSNPDLILRGDIEPRFGQVEKLVEEARLEIGGSAAIVAAGAARLGVSVALVAAGGEDALGRAQIEALRHRGVEVGALRTLPGVATGVSVILSRGEDRAILTSPGAIPALEAAMVDAELLRSARHVHVSSLFLLTGLRPGLPGLLAAARAAGATVSLDTNWDPAGDWVAARRELDLVLPEVDVFFPNLAEARALSGEDEPEAAAAALARRVDLAVVTLGAEGALAHGSDGTVARAAAPAVAAVDTTGAGDSFAAGFLAARLRGEDLEGCLALGCACGALSTTAAGGTAAQPQLAAAEALRARG